MTDTPLVIDVDIVSDVMCPWCIIGYRQLEAALARTGYGMRVRWHPFELNPAMPAEGQNLAEHLAEKYGTTAAQSAKMRAQMQALGQSLGIAFNWTDASRIVNTFDAHQLLEFALSQGRQHPLKCALFEAHFTHGKDVSDRDVLLSIAEDVGLDREAASAALASGALAQSVRDKQAFWTQRGVTGVPTMIFAGQYLVTGAQGIENYQRVLTHTAGAAA